MASDKNLGLLPKNNAEAFVQTSAKTFQNYVFEYSKHHFTKISAAPAKPEHVARCQSQCGAHRRFTNTLVEIFVVKYCRTST